MDIGQYISELLKEHNEVSLPGLGTFFKQRVSAYFNEAERTFYPPVEKIVFKAEEGSSSLLVNHIIASKQLSESSARYFIERFCENIKNTLNKNSSVIIAPLGTILKTDSGYTLESDSNKSASFFGLKPIKEPAAHIGRAPIATHTPIEEETLEYTSERSVSSSKGIWITLTVLFLLGTISGLAYFYYPQYFKNINFPSNNKPSRKAFKPVIKRDSIRDSVSFADSIVRQLESQGMHGAQVEKAKDTLKISSKITSPDTLEITPQAKKTYAIIVASFGLKSEAETSIKNLRHRGIDAKILVDSRKPKFKVSIGTFTTIEAAKKENKRIQQDLIKDAWVLTVINKEN